MSEVPAQVSDTDILNLLSAYQFFPAIEDPANNSREIIIASISRANNSNKPTLGTGYKFTTTQDNGFKVKEITLENNQLIEGGDVSFDKVDDGDVLATTQHGKIYAGLLNINSVCKLETDGGNINKLLNVLKVQNGNVVFTANGQVQAQGPEGKGPEGKGPEGKGPEVPGPEGKGPGTETGEEQGPEAQGPEGPGPKGSGQVQLSGGALPKSKNNKTRRKAVNGTRKWK